MSKKPVVSWGDENVAERETLTYVAEMVARWLDHPMNLADFDEKTTVYVKGADGKPAYGVDLEPSPTGLAVAIYRTSAHHKLPREEDSTIQFGGQQVDVTTGEWRPR